MILHYGRGRVRFHTHRMLFELNIVTGNEDMLMLLTILKNITYTPVYIKNECFNTICTVHAVHILKLERYRED